MTEPAFMKYVRWPDCSRCLGRGFYVDPKTDWPTECERCANGRKDAIKNAKNEHTRERKAGRDV